MKRPIRLTAVAVVAVAGVLSLVLAASGGTPGTGTQNKVLGQAIAVETGTAKPAPHMAQVSGGVVNAALDFTGKLEARIHGTNGPAGPGGSPPLSQADTQGCQNVFTMAGSPANVRVNQDCSLRRQAEEVIVADPNNPNHLIAGQNDSRLGFNKCGYDWSFDGGKTWGDQVPPFYQFQMADGHTADACSDPTATFDSQGNAYVAGVLFDLASPASAFVVAKSNADAGGTFYHSPANLSFQEYRDTPLGVVASDNNPDIFNDKEFIVADATASSPKADNVYATWTRFDTTGCPGSPCHSPIYFSQSTNGGATWSPGIEISGSNPAYCTDFSGESDPNACDQDQGSHPIVGKDGTIYVAYGNGNTPNLGVNQHLMVSCPASADCSNAASWTTPSKIGDDFGFQPFGPVASTACPGGRQCLPPNGYRMDDFVEGSIGVDDSGTLYSAWADGRNIGANCNPLGPAATATPPCDNDVFYAYSTDGGATWSTTVDVTPASEIGPSAQWQPWSAVSPDGKKYYVAYYDREYGNCETTGCNDITLATISKAATGSPKIKYQRITTASMPNLVPANNPIQAGFIGDYMWVSSDSHGNPLIAWADTRGLRGAVEEDLYAATP
jgi:hypothetical protein